jgi:starch synthase (maltosyl-transferring)
MLVDEGIRRVVITEIFPTVENGRYPAKLVVDEEVTFTASVFGDGHDDVKASVFVKHSQTPEVIEIPMTFVINDQWKATHNFQTPGTYEFWIEGWEDHFETWKKGLKKKFEAGQDIKVELQIGVQLLQQAAEFLTDDRTLLLDTATQLSEVEPLEGVALAMDEQLGAILFKFHPKERTTLYPQIFLLDVERERAAFSAWYELFPRSASSIPDTHGTFKDVITLLPRIKKMGFNVLYFPPIHPIGEVNRKGKNNSLIAGPDDPGSPWAIGNRLGGHKSIHPQLGTLKDFKALIKKAEQNGIEIAMDIAYQCAPDHPYVKSHPQWFKWRPDGTVQFAENPPKKYEDILPFDFETEDWENLWKELKSVIDYWIDAGIRIFRIDNPHTKSFYFWEWMITEVRKKNPEVIFLAEAFTRPRLMERLAKAGFNQSYTYFTWRNTKYELETYMKELVNTESRHYFRPNFWPNTPDILPPALINGAENAHILRLILAATLSSNYGVYGPVYEFAINTPHGQKEEYVDNEKYEIKHWDWNKYTRIQEIMTMINRIRSQNKALQSTWNISFLETTSDQIICYSKVDLKSGNRLLIAVNLDVTQTQSAYIKIPFDVIQVDPSNSFKVHDLLSGDQYDWIGEWQYIELNPYLMPAHIFLIEQ